MAKSKKSFTIRIKTGDILSLLKNSLFYQTDLGAHVGDIFMSIIQTCNLAKVNAFDYLTQILKNSRKVFNNPELWMPWNYQTALNQPS